MKVYPHTTGKSSDWFGLCEVCKKHASEVFINAIGDYKQNYIYGHEACVKTA